MSCGCGSNPQPEKMRLVRNVNSTCASTSSNCTPVTCTRIDWLQGVGCCGGYDVSDCALAVEQGAIARLCAVFKNSAKQLVDPTDPRITIKDPSNNPYVSAQPMTRESVGSYVYNFGTNGETTLGKWTAIVTGVVSNITVRTEYLFCMLPVGMLPREDMYGYGYGYGYGDETYGNDIRDGADGFGTFSGREKCGFDGNVSKDIPSTGGCRTNRNPEGDGFWDGISYEDTCITPIGKRGQCMKDRAVAMTRVKVKDIAPECVTGDTVVTTTLGHKRIDEVKEGDNLWVYNMETKKYSFEPVRKKIVNATKTGQIYKFTTKRGRTLKCTPSHKMVLNNGFKFASQCEVGELIAVNPLASTSEIHFDTEKVFFDINDLLDKFPNCTSATQTEAKKWFPIKGQTAVIFARLVGFMFGDGHLDKRLNQINFASDCVDELTFIKSDLNVLQINSHNINTYSGPVTAISCKTQKQSTHNGTTTYFSVSNAAFGKTLQLLGVPAGDKAIQQYDIPDWILEDKWLLKNFLSAYYGADGCNVINSTGIREINFSFNKDVNIDVQGFIKQWQYAFAQFDILLRVREEPNSGAVRKDGVTTTKWVLVPECSEAEAIIKFAEQIGSCYHPDKARSLAIASEYLRDMIVSKSEAENERQKVFDCLHDGLSRMEIVDEIHPDVSKKERAVLWNRYDKWIRGNKEAIELAIANVKKSNDAQQTIYSYVMEQPETRSHGEVARDIVQRFEQEFDICGMVTKYQSVWATVKSWRNGRIPDSKRYDYCLKDFDKMKAWSSKNVGVNNDECSLEKWKAKYVIENCYFDQITKIEVEDSDEDVYDCKFDKLYLLAECVVIYDCWAFTEDEIDMHLEASLADFNATPAFTCFTWDTLPEIYLGIVAQGAQVFALFAQGLLEAGREFNITDNGIAFTPPQISGYMQTAASTLLSIYVQERDKIKANVKPAPAGVGTFRVTSLMPTLARLRHLRAKQII